MEGKVKKFKFNGKQMVLIETGRVYQDGTKHLTVETDDGFPYATLSVYVPMSGIDNGEYLIKGWSENERIFEHLVSQKILQPTGDVVPTGRVVAHICKVNW